MDKYCDASFAPTQGFLEFYHEVGWEAFGWGGSEEEGGEGEGGDEGSSSSSSSSMQASSDPIGTSTDVSLYYTMSVTRSDAYDLAVPTGPVGNVTFTSTRISDGRIVPTAVNDAEESGSGSSSSTASASASASGSEDAAASTTSSADSGVAATVYAGAAGLFAVAALVGVGL